MEEMYFTIAGCSHYYGTQFMVQIPAHLTMHSAMN